MGKYLTVFKDETEAVPFKEEFGGDLYSWNDLVKDYDELK
jgi:nitrous oxide reductase accessory protein NosL